MEVGGTPRKPGGSEAGRAGSSGAEAAGSQALVTALPAGGCDLCGADRETEHVVHTFPLVMWWPRLRLHLACTAWHRASGLSPSR